VPEGSRKWYGTATFCKARVAQARVSLPLAGALGGLLLWALWLEPRRVVMRHETLHLPGWPRELDGMRAAVIADLHTGSGDIDEQRVARVVAKVNRESPDLVALLGDYVTPRRRSRDRSRSRGCLESCVHASGSFVSRGLGTSRLPIRFLAPPEVPVLELRPRE
jgi:predicted MPP superfamily phosphohydrolase